MVSIDFNKSQQVTMHEYYNERYGYCSSDKKDNKSEGKSEKFQKLLEENIELLSQNKEINN